MFSIGKLHNFIFGQGLVVHPFIVNFIDVPLFKRFLGGSVELSGLVSRWNYIQVGHLFVAGPRQARVRQTASRNHHRDRHQPERTGWDWRVPADDVLPEARCGGSLGLRSNGRGTRFAVKRPNWRRNLVKADWRVVSPRVVFIKILELVFWNSAINCFESSLCDLTFQGDVAWFLAFLVTSH